VIVPEVIWATAEGIRTSKKTTNPAIKERRTLRMGNPPRRLILLMQTPNCFAL
jgi:hypothetical protein